MVNGNPILLPDPLKYTSVLLSEVYSNNIRLEADAYNLEAKAAKNLVEHCKYGYVYLWGENGLVEDAFVCDRFKRVYVEKSKEAIPFYLPSVIMDVYPKPSKYISDRTNVDIDTLRVKKGMLLMSVSGTVGRCSIVGDYLNDAVFSHDLLRLYGKGPFDTGYIYAFFCTSTGQQLVQNNNYGAVIQHIEPEHLRNIVIPNAPESIKEKIHNLVMESYDLRDQSNSLMDEAEQILFQELRLPPIEELKPKYFDGNVGLRNYSIKLSRTDWRLDCSYHSTAYDVLIGILKTSAAKIVPCGSPEISEAIVLPTRFKRTYVGSSFGLKFIGGKQINELNPSSEKYLAHSSLDSELKFVANSVLITRSGTIGKVALVPQHWENWIGSDHIFRIIPADNDIAGYLYCWLNTDYAQQLIKRNTFGAVIDEIDAGQLAKIEIPLLKNESKQKEINGKVLKANELRYQAYLKEREAVLIMNEIINDKK